MGYFQELAARPENAEKRAAKQRARQQELATKVFETKTELISAYAQTHNITEQESARLARQEWTGPVDSKHYWMIRSNPNSAYSAAWGKTIAA
jgi:hypothetical protein